MINFGIIYGVYSEELKNSKANRWIFRISNSFNRTLIKMQSDLGKELYISVFQILLTVKSIHQSVIFSDTGPSIAERVFRWLPIP